MAKKGTRFYCTDCGHEELRWLGKCPGCGQWNTFAEMKVADAGTGKKGARGFRATSAAAGPVGFGGSGARRRRRSRDVGALARSHRTGR